jgi:hypothetical protein
LLYAAADKTQEIPMQTPSPTPAGPGYPYLRGYAPQPNSAADDEAISEDAVSSDSSDDDDDEPIRLRVNPCTNLCDGIVAFADFLRDHAIAVSTAVISAPHALGALNRHLLHAGDPAYALGHGPQGPYLPGTSQTIALDAMMGGLIVSMAAAGAFVQGPMDQHGRARSIGLVLSGQAAAMSVGTVAPREASILLVSAFGAVLMASLGHDLVYCDPRGGRR